MISSLVPAAAAEIVPRSQVKSLASTTVYVYLAARSMDLQVVVALAELRSNDAEEESYYLISALFVM